MLSYMTTHELYDIAYSGSEVEKDSLEYVELSGWVRTNRCNGQVGFIELNDGTYFKNTQVVYTKDTQGFEEIQKKIISVLL